MHWSGVLELCTPSIGAIEVPVYHTLMKVTHMLLSFIALGV